MATERARERATTIEPVQIHKMTTAEFEEARDKHLQPTSCLRCGRILYSASSILRGYGMKCAWTQALEELSYGTHGNPEKPPIPDAATFIQTDDNIWDVVGRNGVTVGHITRKGEAYQIELWGDKVDFDMVLANAKRRALRVLERMGR